MACGHSHTVTLSDDDGVHSFGRNREGQLGLGHNNIVVSLPTPIPNLPKIMEVSCGCSFTVCIDNEGGLWSFGDNKFGQLGTKNKKTKNIPQKIANVPSVQSVSCGYYHTLIITHDSKLWSCGHNAQGQLCLGNKKDKSKFKKTAFQQISKIHAGGNHSLFQNIDGEIFACGCNFNGQLGLDHFNEAQIEVTLIPNLPLNIVDFCAGFSHSLFLDSEGIVFSVGGNMYGQLGIGKCYHQTVSNQIPNIPPIQKISCVDYSSYLVDVDGNLWSFGNNAQGQLGLGDLIQRNVPTKTSLRNILQISPGSLGSHFLAKDSQNKIFVMGNNNSGQLGTGTSKNYFPIPIEMNSQYFPIWSETQIVCRAKSARK